MRKVLFVIGCVMFFWSFLMFLATFVNAQTDNITKYFDIDYYRKKPFFGNLLYVHTVWFFIGTYLMSNNKPPEKD